MTRDDADAFIRALNEPALVLTVDGYIIAKNDAFSLLALRNDLPSNAETLQDYLDADPGDLQAFLALGAQSRPVVPGGFALRTTTTGDGKRRFRCECAILRMPTGDDKAWLFVRLLPTSEASQRFRLLNENIERLNGEIHRRREVEKALLEAHRTLEDRVAERTADLERLNKELRRSNQALEEFAYVASHDLQEPLRKIQIFAEMLEETVAARIAEEDRDMFERLIAAAGRMQRLVSGLLEYSRVSTKPQMFERINLARTIEQVKTDLELRVKETGAHIEVENLPVIFGDPLQIYQLFQNLILNSLKFRRESVSPHIIISKSAEEREDGRRAFYEVTLEDNGIGFEAAFAERIFHPFQRLNPKHLFEGTGIGLTICRKIVERHEGTIRAEGRPGAGARFVMRFPKEMSSQVLAEGPL